MEKIEHREMLLSEIRKITSDLFVSRFDGYKLSLAFEDPKYGLNRIANSKFVTEEYENYKLLLADERSLFYPEHTTQKYNRELTVDKVMENEQFQSLCSRFSGKNQEEWIGDYLLLNDAVNSFFKVFDNLSFKRNKSMRTIKSNTHDIEHIIYAVMAKYFVSDDDNLRERTTLIYEVLGIETQVLSPTQLLDNLNHL